MLYNHYNVSALRENPNHTDTLHILTEIRVTKTNVMHYLSSVYFVNQPLHVSGMFVAHHQEAYSLYTTTGTCCPAFQLTVCYTYV
jgi:hypothetical protein